MLYFIKFSDDKQLEMHQKDMNVHVVYNNNNSNNQIYYADNWNNNNN